MSEREPSTQSQREGHLFGVWYLVTAAVALAALVVFALAPLTDRRAYLLLLLPIPPFVVANRHLLAQLRFERLEREQTGQRYKSRAAEWAFNRHPVAFWLLISAALLGAPFLLLGSLGTTGTVVLRWMALSLLIIVALIAVIRRQRK